MAVLWKEMTIHKLSLLFFFMLVQQYITISSASSQFPLPGRFKSSKESVFIQFNELVSKYNPLDLGTGVPDFPPSKTLQTALANASTSMDYTLSQYSPNAVSVDTKLFRDNQWTSKIITSSLKTVLTARNRTLDPDNNVIITAGAVEALFVSILSHTFHDQVWIIFEPYFELYNTMIRAANGVPRFIKLKPKRTGKNTTSADWTFDKDELTNLFNEKTKGVLLNTPNNPLGKVFSFEELNFIANLAKKWNAIVIADEVYRFLTFDNIEHISIASLPGMFERTITITSAGKMFGATGLSVGWAYGDTSLIDNLKSVHAIAISCASTSIQEAVAVVLEQETRDLGKPHSILELMRKEKEAHRNYLYRVLKDSGMTPILPEGGYFIVANWTTISNSVVLDSEKDECDDYKFAKWLIKSAKVFGLPMSSFFRDVNECSGKDILRFAIAKKNETYVKAEELFSKWQH